MALKLECALESSGGLVKIQISGPIPRASDSVGLRWGLGVCSANSSQVTLMLLVPFHTLITTVLGYPALEGVYSEKSLGISVDVEVKECANFTRSAQMYF